MNIVPNSASGAPLKSHALLGAGIAAALALVAAEASAAVVNVTLAPAQVSGPGGFTTISFNPVSQEVANTFYGDAFCILGCSGSIFFFADADRSSSQNFFAVGLLTSGSDVEPISDGTFIGASAPENHQWLDSTGDGIYPGSDLPTDGTPYNVGFRFKETSGDDWNYGYFTYSILLSPGPLLTGTLYGWNYEATDGQAIVVNAIPEPSTFALLAGACGLGGALMRRRRRT